MEKGPQLQQLDYLESLNEKQREAVLQTEGPVLIVAGAGAGKTKTITNRIFHLIKTGVPAQKILAITFTNKAAREMRERVEKMCLTDGGNAANGKESPESDIAKRYKMGDKPFINTFHALGVHIIKQNARELGLPRFFAIYDKNDGKKLIKDALALKGYDPKQYEPAKIMHIISAEKSKGISASQYAENIGEEYFPKVVATIWLEYEKTLAKEKALDLDDLLLVTMKLLERNTDVRQYYQNLWQYIHIDEYQDTNTVQYKIARYLAEHQNICVVGDADQNIYSWRGADIGNILRFEKDFPGTKTVLLEENYRSTKTILDVANEIIKKNKIRIEKNLFTSQGAGEKIGVYEGWSEIQEAFFIAHKTFSLLEGGVSPDEVAVLYRANFQSRTLEEAFMSLGIPYAMIGIKFFERKEIKDTLSYIRAALNRDSWADIGRVINTPARGIGDVTVDKLRAGQMDKISPATHRKVDVFWALLDKIVAVTKTLPASAVIKYVLKETGFEDIYNKGSDGRGATDEETERWENLMELVTLASRYDDLAPGEGIEAFISDAALATSEESTSADGQPQKSVKLMTVHSAKGLEFDYVFVSGLEQDLFPHRRHNEGKLSQNESEEERRLFYVAVTRARKKIYLTYSLTRTIFGEQEVHTPSEFLYDIPGEHTEKEFLTQSEGQNGGGHFGGGGSGGNDGDYLSSRGRGGGWGRGGGSGGNRYGGGSSYPGGRGGRNEGGSDGGKGFFDSTSGGTVIEFD